MIASDQQIPFLDLRAQLKTIEHHIWPEIQRVISNTQFVLGPAVASFENNFAAFCKAKACVATGSGTDSLHLALLAAGVGPGDEVITQANTFVATLEAIAYTGARPVLVDVQPPTYTIDTDALRAAVTSKTKAIVPVHLFGQPCELDIVYAIAKEQHIAVIEDASQAHGAQYRGKRIGEVGIASFSFYPGKNLGAFGEGGGVTCNDDNFARRMMRLRNHGSTQKYFHEDVGYNYRMDGIQGAVLDVKLRFLESWNNERRRVAALYDNLLAGLHKPTVQPHAEHVYHIYPVFLKNRERVRAVLAEHGIETNAHYPIACHMQPAFKDLGYAAGDFPNSEFMAAHELSLPMYAELSAEQVKYVSHHLLNAL